MNRSRCGALLQAAVAFCVVIVCCGWAAAGTKVWTGAGGDFSWHNAANWSPAGVPGAADDVEIDVVGSITVLFSTGATTIASLQSAENLTISGGTLTISGPSQVGGVLTIAGGTLGGTGVVTVTGALDWTVGSMTGSGETVVAEGATTSMSGSGVKSVANGRKLTHRGIGTWSGSGELAVSSGSSFTIGETGELEVSATGALSGLPGGGLNTFSNQGLLRKLGATQWAASGNNLTVSNAATGTIEVAEGTLQFGHNGNGTNSGAMTVASGAVLRFQAGTWTHGATSQVTGPGTLEFSLGTHTFNPTASVSPGALVFGTATVTFNDSIGYAGPIAIPGGNVTFNGSQSFESLTLGATLGGTGVITVTDSFAWSGGSMTGSGETVVAEGATLSISGSDGKTLSSGRKLTHRGVGTWSGSGGLNVANGSNLTIGETGELDVSATGALTNGSANAASFVNQGLLRKLGSNQWVTSGNFLTVSNASTGTIEVAEGTLQFQQSSAATNSGAMTVASGAVLRFQAGTWTHGATSQVTGPGTLEFSGGTQTFNATATVSPGALVFGTATVTFNGSIDYTGPISITQAGGSGITFNGAQTFESLTLAANSLGGTGVITVTDSFAWSGGSMTGGGETVVAEGATLSISGSDGKTLSSGRKLTHRGVGTWSGSGGLNVANGSNLTIGETGELDVSATGALTNGSANAASFVNQGLLRKLGSNQWVTSGNFLTVSNASTGTIEVAEGTLQFGQSGNGTNSGAMTVASGAVLRFQSGTWTHGASAALLGLGTVNFVGTSTFNASASVSIGAATFAFGSSTTFNGSVDLGPALALTNGFVVFNGAQTFNSLSIIGDGSTTLSGTGPVTVTGSMTWTGGQMSGTGETVVEGGASLSISGSVTKSMTNRKLRLFGQGSWGDGSIVALSSGGTEFIIEEGGELTVANAGSVQGGTGSNFIRNRGLIRKLGSGLFDPTASSNSVGFVNTATGVVEVVAGTFRMNNAVLPQNTNQGTFAVSEGATLSFNASCFHGAASTISGAGHLVLGFGTHNFPASATVVVGSLTVTGSDVVFGNSAQVDPGPMTIASNGSVNFNAPQSFGSVVHSSGDIGGSGVVLITGSYNWSGGGQASGTGETIVDETATISISGSANRNISRKLTIRGTGTWSGTGALNLNNASASMTIAPSGELDASSTGGVTGNFGAFINQGTLRKIGPSSFGTSGSGWSFTNAASGSIEVQQGEMAFVNGAGGSNAGSLTVASGATLRFSSGTWSHGAASSLIGSGTLQFTAGTHTFNATAVVDPGLILFGPSQIVTFNGSIGYDGPVAIPGGSVTFNGSQSFESLSLGGAATLGGTGVITVTDSFAWTGGSMTGSGETVVAEGATLSISGSGDKNLNSGRKLTHRGTGTWSGTGGLAVNNGSNLTIGETGELDVSATGGLSSTTIGNSFVNQGLLRKLGATQWAVVNSLAVSNASTGTIDVAEGTLQFVLSGNGTNSGAMTVASGAVLRFQSGTWTHGATSQVTGPGTLEFSGGTQTFNATATVSPGALVFGGATVTFNGSIDYTGPISITQAGGSGITFNGAQTFESLTLGATLGGTGVITVTDSFAWTGGSMTGGGETVVAEGATLSISGSGDKNLNSGRKLTHRGTGTWSGTGGLAVNNGSNLTIGETGELEVSATGGLSSTTIGNSFVNQGLLRKLGATQWAVVNSLAVSNASTGTIDVAEGTLQFVLSGNGTNSGAMTVASGAVLRFQSSTWTYGSASSISGDGLLWFPSGTHVFPAGAIVDCGEVLIEGSVTFAGDQALRTLRLASGQLGGVGNIEVTELLEWQSTQMQGAASTIVAPDATLVISGNIPRTLAQGRKLVHRGTGSWTGSGTIQIVDSGTQLINEETGVLVVSSTAASVFGGGGGGTVINKGLWQRSGTAASMTFAKPFLNEGTLEVLEGGVVLNGGVSNLAGTTLNGGLWRVAGTGSLGFPVGASVQALDGGARVELDGGGSFPAVASLRTINANASLALTGARDFTASPAGQPLTNAGSIELGPDSELSIVGSFVQTGTGLLAVSSVSSIDPPRVSVTGSAGLDGAVSLSFGGGFAPTLGETVPLLAAQGGIAGAFAQVLHPLTPACVLEVSYAPTTASFGLETVPPTVICKDLTISLDATGNATLSVDDIDDGSFDNCGIASRELSKTSFTCDDVGTNLVTLTVTDAAGNVATCQAIVTVEATARFLGAPGSSWFGADNWCAGLPTEASDVTILVPVQVDQLGATARSIEVLPGGSLTIGSDEGASLSVAETLTIRSGGAVAIAAAGLLDATEILVESGAVLTLLTESSTLMVETLTVAPGATVEWVAGVVELRGSWTQEAPVAVGCSIAAAELVLDQGQIWAPSVAVCSLGTVQGTGLIAGDLDNGGLVQPGPIAGTIVVGGSYVQSPVGELRIALGGLQPGIDGSLLEVSGAASLDGILSTVVAETLQLECGDALDVVFADTLSGVFDEVLYDFGPALPVGLIVEPVVTGSSFGFVVRVATDLSGDGIVDGADLAIFLGAWGNSGGPADFDGDGTVNGADLGILLGSWGAGC